MEREKNVIVQEIGAVEDTPDDLVFDLSPPPLCPNSRSAARSSAPAKGVDAFDARRSTAYLGRHYGARHGGGGGRRSRSRRGGRARRRSRFAGLPTPAAPPEPAVTRRRNASNRRELEQAHVAVAFEGRRRRADHHAAQVFANAAGGGMSSRLFQEVREKRGLGYSIYAFHGPIADTGLFGFYAGSADRDAADRAASLDAWPRPRIGSTKRRSAAPRRR